MSNDLALETPVHLPESFALEENQILDDPGSFHESDQGLMDDGSRFLSEKYPVGEQARVDFESDSDVGFEVEVLPEEH